mmetsp:Transcript_5357/g.9796  ORF Transcript_5357/g.9796 Transcript_5357/m.9796 type:complete len:81 (+) Transcript_5357:92-334(+)
MKVDTKHPDRNHLSKLTQTQKFIILVSSKVCPILLHCVKNVTDVFETKVLLPSKNESKTVCFLIIQWLVWNDHFTSLVQS